MDICTRYLSMEDSNGVYTLHTDAADIRIYFVTQEIVRIWVSFDKSFVNESYILMTTAWEDRLDSLFEGQRQRLTPVVPIMNEQDNGFSLSTDAVILYVEKDPLNFTLYSQKIDRLHPWIKKTLYATLPGNPFVKSSNNTVTAYSSMEEDDYYFGFGEKTGLLNKNKTLQRERATDAMGYDPRTCDTLYKHVPFYIRVDASTENAVGVFYHNFYESEFNMGLEKSNYWSRYSYWQAKGGDIDLFLCAGNSIKKVIDNYTLLTGRPALLPKRAFGYQGSSMYYPELPQNCDTAILDFIDTNQTKGFPMDGFHLSSGYTSDDNHRYVFTWNHRRFRQPEAFLRKMEERHAQVVPNVKPGVLLSHPMYEAFTRENVFIKSSKIPETNAVGKWWGGDGAFWDFTSPRARQAWKSYLTDSLLVKGVRSVWNDNCEYDGLMDEDSICDFDGEGGTIGQLKPVMSTLMSKLGADAITELDKNARPYIVCRSGSAGIQHYAQTWCGDNYTSWDTLKYNIPTILGMGLSGQPNEGADIGGFAGPAPDEELFVRWVQQGIFQPRFSIHSASNDNTVTEPWMFENSIPLILDAMKLRYRLAPYLYSLNYMAHTTGAPIMRALMYDFQNDPKVYGENFEFLFGPGILVANVVEPGATTQKVYLPAGCKWYDFNNYFTCYEGGTTLEVPVDLSTIPMFLREGCVISMADNPMSSMEDVVSRLHLLLAPDWNPEHDSISNGNFETLLYDDDGVSNDYLTENYRLTYISPEIAFDEDRVYMDFYPEGTYPDQVDDVFVEMIAKERAPFAVAVQEFVEHDSSTTLPEISLDHYLLSEKFKASDRGWYYNHTNRTVEIKYPNPKKDYQLIVSFAPRDLIGM